MHDRHSNTFSIKTDRLVIRSIEPAEIGEFHAIARRREIAENLASVPHPLSEEEAREWLAQRTYRGEPDFAAGIFRPDGTMVGCIGLSNNPVTTYYFLASEFWGHGYATEILNPFLDWCVKEFDLAEIKVGVLDDNVGSQRVLEKSGFRNTHATLHQPPFRDAPDRLLMYWKGYGATEPLTITTQHLYIHPVHPGHASRLNELCIEADDFQLLGVVEPPFTPESARQWIMDSLDQPGLHRFAITSKAGLMTGASELTVDRSTGNIRMWMGSKYWNENYGDDALRGLAGLIFDRFPGVEKIVCRVTQKNSPLSHLLKTIGFASMQPGSVATATGNDQAADGLFYLGRASFVQGSLQKGDRGRPQDSHVE